MNIVWKKKKEIDKYTKRFIQPLIEKLFKKINGIKKTSNNEIDNITNITNINNTNGITDYSFMNLRVKLSDEKSLKDINLFFEIFDFIKSKLLRIDYNLFIKDFIKKYEEENIWTFINKISMIKIYGDLIHEKNEEKLSIINEKNYLSKSIFENIIDDFKIEHINGLYDYIFFKNNFTIDKENIKNEMDKYLHENFEKFYDNYEFNINDNNHPNYNYVNLVKKNSLKISYLQNKQQMDQKSKVEKEQDINKWNKFIEYECLNEENLNIIYDKFDKFDSNDYRCRKKFYKKIFQIIYNNKDKYLNDIIFINAIMILILKDEKNIYKILSLNDTIDNDNNTKIKLENIFSEIIMKITEIITKENMNGKNEGEKLDTIKKEILINSLIMFLKLFGEYNNIQFHKIICKDLNYLKTHKKESNEKESDEKKSNSVTTYKKDLIDNSEDKNEFIVIKKLFNLYIKTYLSFDLKGNFPLIKKNNLIFFDNLTQCIIEYTNISEKIKIELKKILEVNEDDLKKQDELFHEKIKIICDIKNKENKKNKRGEENENLKKLYPIIYNSSLFYIYCLKIINVKDEHICEEALKRISSYFKIFLSANGMKLNNNDDKMIEDKEKLLDSYRNNKFKNTDFPLFDLILLNYQIIFYFLNISGFEIYKSFFYINDENNLDIANNFINKKFNGECKDILPLFLFLEEIRDIIEIKIDGRNIELMNILIPEIFNLTKYSKTYFNNIIDYSDRENKLSSIYNYIDCLICDIKQKKI